MVIADDAGNIHGYLGINPRPFLLDGTPVNGGEMTTWMVSPELKGKGFAPRLVKLAIEQFDFLAAINPTPDSFPAFLRLGFRYIQYMPRYVRVLNTERVTGAGDFTSLGRRLVRLHESWRIPFTGSAEEIPVADAAQEAALLTARHNHFIRDREHLCWRYQDHPVFTHRAFRIQHQGATCVAVIRLDRSPSMSVLYVLDLFGEPEAFSGAASFLDSLARDENMDIAEFCCTSEAVTAPFWEQGWFSTQDDPHAKIPHLFYPLELRSPPTNRLIIRGRPPYGSLFDRSRLYLTKADLDMDRPNQAYLDFHGCELTESSANT